MPIYEYLRPTCSHKFDKLQSMNDRGSDCPRCGQPARLSISLFSAVSTGEDGDVGSVAGMGGCGACAGGSCACAAH